MLLLLLEALLALALLLFIVWWTMFSGRNKGEPRREETNKDSAD
jgi:cbb3-type cytochrome oxidase subunit 3